MNVSGWGKWTPHPIPHTPEGLVLPLSFLQTLFPASVGSNPISHEVGFKACRRKQTCWQLNELSATQTSWWHLEQSIKWVRIGRSAVFRNEVSLERKEIFQGKENNATALAQCLKTNSRISYRQDLLLKCLPGRLGCYCTSTQSGLSAF